MNIARCSSLVLHQGALGDWVLVFPFLRALAPRGVLVVTAGAKAKLAARLIPGVAPADLDARPWSSLFAVGGNERDDTALRLALRDVREIFSFISQPADTVDANFRRLLPGTNDELKLFHITPRPPSDWIEHVTRWHHQQIVQQGVSRGDSIITNPRRDSVSPPMSDPIVVHPGSGGRGKLWPIERFEALIAALSSRGLKVRAVLGEVEADTWPAEQLARWRERWRARQTASLNDLCDELSTVRGFVGNDSGPAHLAAAMGMDTLAIFGPSDPRVWSPVSPGVRVLSPPSPRAMTWASVEDVLDAMGLGRE